MGLPSRQIRQDEREKPRDLSVVFALPYPVECPALVTHDDDVRAWSVLFWPAFAAGNVVKALHVTTDNGKTWPTVGRKKLTYEYVKSAVEASLLAGKTGKPCHLDGEGLIHAIGVRFAKDEPTCIMNVDLDGRTDAREFVRSMVGKGVRGLLTSSSGKPGKFRFLVFLDRWYTIGEVQALGKTLCESLGFIVKKGAVEIFPSAVNGRLPCGYGALTVYDPAYLNEGLVLPLRAFLRTFHALRRVELARIVDELKPAPTFAAERSEEDARIVDAIFPEFEKVVHEHEHASNDQRTSTRMPTRGAHIKPPERVLRWEKCGFEPGERQSGLFDLAIHAWYRKKNQAQTLDYLTKLVRRGLIRRSNFMKEFDNPIARQISELSRIVRGAFAVARTFRVTKAKNAPLAHLTEDEFVMLDADVQRVATQQDRTWTAKRAKAFAWYIVQWFKGAMVAGHVDDKGRPIALIHWTHLQVAAGNRQDYAALRDAFPWFEPITDYCSEAKALGMYGDASKAYATTYAFIPSLTRDVTKRALGRTWDDAVKVATKRLARRTA